MDVMVAVDLEQEADAVLERALPWCARIAGRVHLRAVSEMLWEPDEVFGGTETQALAQEWERRRRAEAERLSQLASDIPDAMAGTHEIVQGSPGRALVETSRQFDLVMVGTHGRTGLERLFLGSVAERVVRQAHIPVLVLPLASEPIISVGPLNVTLPVDAAQPDLSAAKRVVAWLGDAVSLHLVYALADLRLSQEIGMALSADTPDTHPHRRWAETQLREALREAGLEASLHFVLAMGNNPALELASFAEAHQADAIAVTTHGRRGVARVMFGSVAERLVRLAHVPCLVVR